MKNILMIQSGAECSGGVFEFAKKLNEIEPICLVCFFLPELADARTEGVYAVAAPIADDEKELSRSIGSFEALCARNNIACLVRKGTYDLYVPQMQRETLYADLLIIGSEVFFRDVLNATGAHIEETARNAKCPVLVVPEYYSFPQKIVLAYNEDPCSAFAIKQFAYLFPQLCKLPASLFYRQHDKHDEIPNRQLIEELVACHFPKLAIAKRTDLPDEDIADRSVPQNASLMVFGSYHRSALSVMFRKSFARDIIMKHKLPVFIAHPDR